MNSIEVSHISTGYGEQQVIEDLSLAIEHGGFIGIIGPNGCGKSTLLKSMTRVLKPTGGAVYIEGKELGSIDSKELAKIVGCVNQATDTAFAFTVHDIVMMGRHPYIGRLRPLSKDDLRIVDEAMKYTGVDNLRDRLITELSGGERQRVLIAKTLAQQPKILLLDEPTNHLDICYQIDILQLLRKLTPEITVICVLHDLNLAACYCDQLVLMNNGKIQAIGAPAEVLTPKAIYDIFSVRMLISPHPVTGKPYLVPQYGVFSSPGSRKIHVISGGGSGTELLYALALRGYAMTAGVLSANDSDAAAAETLGIEIILEPPFAPVSDASVEKLKATIAESDMVIVSGMPIGQGNLINLSVLLETDKPVYLMGTFTDFSSGRYEPIKEKLLQCGAVCVDDVPAMVDILTGRTA